MNAILLPSGDQAGLVVESGVVGEPRLARAVGVHHVDLEVAVAVAVKAICVPSGLGVDRSAAAGLSIGVFAGSVPVRSCRRHGEIELLRVGHSGRAGAEVRVPVVDRASRSSSRGSGLPDGGRRRSSVDLVRRGRSRVVRRARRHEPQAGLCRSPRSFVSRVWPVPSAFIV